MSQVERLTTEMTKAGGDRSSLLIAFGGGVTGDVGGFVSAIYMRGIDYVQVPTTLLSQVDSSVGGKTGVNLQTGKNLVGCFYPPQAVVADISLLSTLPQRELRAGIYESIKAGLIRDAALFRFIESQREAIDQGDSAAIEKMVAASGGYDLPAYEKLTTFKTWAEEGPPKGTLYHYPNPYNHQILSIAASPAPPKVAQQIYVQATLTKMAQRFGKGEKMEDTLAWAETEVEGFMRT